MDNTGKEACEYKIKDMRVTHAGNCPLPRCRKRTMMTAKPRLIHRIQRFTIAPPCT